jgi:hypothetical protein
MPTCEAFLRPLHSKKRLDKPGAASRRALQKPFAANIVLIETASWQQCNTAVD